MIGGGARGWFNESYRHYLARKGIRTKQGSISRFLDLRKMTRAERMRIADVQVPARGKLALRRAMARPLGMEEKEEALRQLRWGVFADIPERQKKLEEQIIAATGTAGVLQPGISGVQAGRAKKALAEKIVQMSLEDRAGVQKLLEEYGKLREVYPAKEKAWFANIALYAEDVVKNPDAYRVQVEKAKKVVGEAKVGAKVKAAKGKVSEGPSESSAVWKWNYLPTFESQGETSLGSGEKVKLERELRVLEKMGRAVRAVSGGKWKVKDSLGEKKVSMRKGDVLVQLDEGRFVVIDVKRDKYVVRAVPLSTTEFPLDV